MIVKKVPAGANGERIQITVTYEEAVRLIEALHSRYADLTSDNIPKFYMLPTTVQDSLYAEREAVMAMWKQMEPVVDNVYADTHKEIT